ncbi:hypothetical protein HanXRQr2_Chr08g0331491 [Helianthus annuus]|uniref:Uncharacterized protein n=1 Tax=Helianthus annuus TaxID=4232 RepID=A0A9K3NC05_HELAN|nr:hypothetical protein HanXRQr2_Chr08g0331491 [Helianthus annuus]KAJ0830792.1 hypothetical protein HanPSC8_Chr15g0659511 [Helianthus annuus]KAJ0901025.1 hypothetical protein HanPSC8_Chr08g0320521 [Helianthus annuus]
MHDREHIWFRTHVCTRLHLHQIVGVAMTTQHHHINTQLLRHIADHIPRNIDINSRLYLHLHKTTQFTTVIH